MTLLASGLAMLPRKIGDVVVVRGHPYQLVSVLGKGGQGAVFEARNDRGKRVAIKFVPAHPRHRAEIRILASLNSDHVVKLLDAGVAQGTLILVLEHVEGVDLKQLVRWCRQNERCVPAALAVQLLSQACIGLLDATRDARLAFHRDIKPGNIILERSGRIKLIDFGIAHQAHMDYTGSLIGTPENMAPEQVGLNSDWRVDIRTDLYCLGLVLFELLALETLFVFPQSMPIPERLMEVWHADTRDRVKMLEQAYPATGAFLKKALRRNPGGRFQTPNEMLEELSRLHARVPVVEVPDNFAESLYQAYHHGKALPRLVEQSLPISSVDPTVSLELDAYRESGLVAWLWQKPPVRLFLAGIATLAFTILILIVVMSILGSDAPGL